MSRRSDHENVLSVELERAALRALASTWESLSWTYFGDQMLMPIFALSDAPGRLGRWVPEHRTIEIARRALTEHGWGVIVEVLKHEMAHQFVDEHLVARDEAAHGPAFRRVCAERGFDARASGAPVAPEGQGESEHRVLERVAKLLALAQSDSEHEAQAAMKAAQRLMLKYNLDAVASGRAGSYGFRHLGRATGRISESESMLASILGSYFFVDVIWVPVWRPLEGKRGSVLEVIGSPENLELAEYVYSFLTTTAERLWREYKKARGISRNANRRTFMAGVMAGFRDKLQAQKQADTKQGLVWVGDRELDAYFRKRHPRVRSVRSALRYRPDAYNHGREAGSRIVLTRGVSQGPSRGTLSLPPAPGR